MCNHQGGWGRSVFIYPLNKNLNGNEIKLFFSVILLTSDWDVLLRCHYYDSPKMVVVIIFPYHKSWLQSSIRDHKSIPVLETIEDLFKHHYGTSGFVIVQVPLRNENHSIRHKMYLEQSVVCSRLHWSLEGIRAKVAHLPCKTEVTAGKRVVEDRLEIWGDSCHPQQKWINSSFVTKNA